MEQTEEYKKFIEAFGKPRFGFTEQELIEMGLGPCGNMLRAVRAHVEPESKTPSDEGLIE
jgi:hypothetical protein